MTTIAVIDDHPLYRQGLAQAVASAADLTVVGTYSSVDEYLAAAPAVDVVLLDYHLPGLSGPPAVRSITERGAVVLMVSANIAQQAVLDTLAAGARGYVTKHAEVDDIVHAVHTVSDPDPGTYVSPALAAYLLEAANDPGPAGLELSAREQEVLGLVAAGERDQDIAEILYISLGTVRSHLDHIRTKTGHRRRADLTRFAVDHGITTPRPTDPR